MAHRLWWWQARKKVSKALSEKEKKIIKALDENISKMSDAEKMYLLGRIEGMAYAANRKEGDKETTL